MKTNLLLLFFVCFIGLTFGQQRNQLKTNQAPFFHGVASGDPIYDRVIIWTRITPDEINNDSIPVNWRIATDTSMTNIVNSGVFKTHQDRDYTVKIDVTGLNPSTCYYYDFNINQDYSVRGRAITADLGDNENVRFAVVSCSNYEYGFFNVYNAIAERNDVNAVLHLGDYIYEYATGGYSANIADRTHEPTHEIVTLDDYRLRYSHYRLDNDLQRVHQQYPFICVWDDHESANDSWVNGAENHDAATQGNWIDRKNNAKKAYFEWLPIRENALDTSIYRKIEYGDLVNLYMLDTRLEGRDEQVGATSSDLNDTTRTLLGGTQLNWLKSELTGSQAQWNILGQQVMMAPLKVFGTTLNTDQWDGYPLEREEILNHIVDNNIENVVVLTGDIHTSWANDLPMAGYNASTGANSGAVEFVTTSVTSPGFPIAFGVSLIQSLNNHIKWAELTKKGYIVLDIDKNRTQSEWYFIDDITTPGNNNQSFAKAYYVNNQQRFLNESSSPSQSSETCFPAPLYPFDPANLSIDTQETSLVQLFGVYPNPFNSYFILHMGAAQHQIVTVKMYDLNGREVFQQENVPVAGGSEYLKVHTEGLESGLYSLVITTPTSQMAHKIVKF
jgi:alkaline phosphatase D